MKDAVGDGGDGAEGADENEEGVNEGEEKGVGVNGVVEIESMAEEQAGDGGERAMNEALQGGVDNEGEGEWKEEDEGESEEVARVSSDDALRFREESPEAERWSLRRRRHGQRWVALPPA